MPVELTFKGNFLAGAVLDAQKAIADGGYRLVAKKIVRHEHQKETATVVGYGDDTGLARGNAFSNNGKYLSDQWALANEEFIEPQADTMETEAWSEGEAISYFRRKGLPPGLDTAQRISHLETITQPASGFLS